MGSHLLLRIFFSLLVLYIGWRLMGPIGVVLFSPVVGVILVKPILELFSAPARLGKQAVFDNFEGIHFVHAGTTFDILEDAASWRWLKTSEIRLVLPDFPRDEVLMRLYPEGVRRLGPNGFCRMQAESLESFLVNSLNRKSIAFRNWLRKDVIHSASQTRKRLAGDPTEPRSERD